MIRLLAILALIAAIPDAAAQERKHLNPGFLKEWQGLPSGRFDGSKIPEYKPLRTIPVRKNNFGYA